MAQPLIIKWDQAFNRNGDKSLPRQVGNVIRLYMNNDTLEGYVSQQRLADDTGLTDHQVRRQIDALELAGWVEVTTAPEKRGKVPNTYRLLFPNPDIQGNPDIYDQKPALDVLHTSKRTSPESSTSESNPDIHDRPGSIDPSRSDDGPQEPESRTSPPTRTSVACPLTPEEQAEILAEHWAADDADPWADLPDAAAPEPQADTPLGRLYAALPVDAFSGDTDRLTRSIRSQVQAELDAGRLVVRDAREGEPGKRYLDRA